MAGTANVVPSELVAVYDAVSAGDLERARKSWAQIYPLIEAIMASTVHRGGQGRPGGGGLPRRRGRVPPIAKLDPAAAARIVQLAKTTTTMETTMRITTGTPRRRCAGYGPGESSRRPTCRPGQHFIDGALRPGGRGHRHRRGRSAFAAKDASGRADTQGTLLGAAPRRRPGRRERRPPRPPGVGQHRQAVGCRTGRRRANHRPVPLRDWSTARPPRPRPAGKYAEEGRSSSRPSRHRSPR